MNIFNGKEKADFLDKQIIKYLSDHEPPGNLAIILIGNNPASEKYVEIKRKYCDSRGIKCSVHKIDERLKDDDIFQKVISVLASPETGGVIIQLPLPRKSLDPCLRMIPAEKDIDAISPASMDAFYSGHPRKILPVIRALEMFVKETGRDPNKEKLKAVVIGEGFLVGKPAAHFLRSIGYDVNVIVSYQRGQKIEADLLVLSAGVANLVRGEDISIGCDVVDFGSSIVEGKTVGDLDRESSSEHLGLVSFSPGGVGPLVVRFLIMNFLGI
ncbi:MAG: bifunctional protein FolD [Patescibacteria group bacterium]|nr:MAG: bifunctional protein FolD [Patescibacteria group bacterium]